MTQEKPLVTWKEIAAYLGVSRRTAKKIVRKIKVPFLEAYLPRKAVYASDLQQYIKRPIKDP